MRTTDERLTAVENRVKELQWQKKQRRYQYIGISAIAACLIVIVGMGIAMPGIVAGFSGRAYTNTGVMASLFYEGKALGYVLTGVLAFVLGVCLTVLCYRLHPAKQRHKEDSSSD